METEKLQQSLNVPLVVEPLASSTPGRSSGSACCCSFRTGGPSGLFNLSWISWTSTRVRFPAASGWVSSQPPGLGLSAKSTTSTWQKLMRMSGCWDHSSIVVSFVTKKTLKNLAFLATSVAATSPGWVAGTYQMLWTDVNFNWFNLQDAGLFGIIDDVCIIRLGRWHLTKCCGLMSVSILISRTLASLAASMMSASSGGIFGTWPNAVDWCQFQS